MLQRLWLSGARKRISLNIPDQTDDAEGLRPILFHPPREILESRCVKSQAS
jgi:hypothetical protein